MHFDGMIMMMFTFHKTKTLRWIFYSTSSLKQLSTGIHVAPIGYNIYRMCMHADIHTYEPCGREDITSCLFSHILHYIIYIAHITILRHKIG
jgi:hypothetical protein